MLERHLHELIAESLQHSPVVLLLGPRQVGKSTLVEALATEGGATCCTLDDRALLDAALRDPDGLVASGGGGLQVYDEGQQIGRAHV